MARFQIPKDDMPAVPKNTLPPTPDYGPMIKSPEEIRRQEEVLSKTLAAPAAYAVPSEVAVGEAWSLMIASEYFSSRVVVDGYVALAEEQRRVLDFVLLAAPVISAKEIGTKHGYTHQYIDVMADNPGKFGLSAEDAQRVAHVRTQIGDGAARPERLGKLALQLAAASL